MFWVLKQAQNARRTVELRGEGHPPVPGAVFLAKPFSLTELVTLVGQQVRAPNGSERAVEGDVVLQSRAQ